jgi:hypothetical protein
MAAAALASDRAEAHGTVHYDSATLDPAVHGNNTNDGPGVQGDSVGGSGVVGTTAGGFQSAGVRGVNTEAGNLNAYGVFGWNADIGRGVEGQSIQGVGVEGTSHHGVGVAAGSLDGIAFDGFAPAGIAALRLGGKVRLSTVSHGTIPAGSDSVTVPHGHVTADSHISITFTSDPGNASVSWISRVAAGPLGVGGSFTVHLDRRIRNDTTFTYSILEPFAPGL